MKYVFDNLTFIIPARFDSIIRLENILAVIKFIKSLGSNIIVYEASNYNNKFLKRLLPPNCKVIYRHILDHDPVFHRTHYLNMMTKEVQTPFVVIWDADVIVAPQQIQQSITSLNLGHTDVSFPYNGLFLDLGYTIRAHYVVNHDINYLLKYQSYMNYMYGKNFVGGGIIVNREKYIAAGMENEKFYGWGPEDLDRMLRWNNMNYDIHRSDGPMFHLTHPRDLNGYIRSKCQDKICRYNAHESAGMSSNEIKLLYKNND